MEKHKILNIELLNIELPSLLQQLERGVLITPNVDHLMKLQKDRGFYELYRKTEWIICDSNIVQLALRFLGNPVRQVIPGSTFFPAYCAHHKDHEHIRLFLLGAAPGIAAKAAENINRKAGRSMVVAAHSPSYGFEKNEAECLDIVDKVNASGATVLVVGVGAPKQEKWIFAYKELMPNIQVFMALGATIDFEAGTLQRAPRWVQKLSMEWLYRLLKEPRRLWKRYMVDDLPFFYLILKAKMGRYRDPFSGNIAPRHLTSTTR
ncbi:WecB/TagA/CpsF family glycosyltransferase [Sphingobacterium suaedae]|uniref:WecB/TagA/CpsF family glycosyltransferase n=1 Tax=Sphingobacterium suaedae TaxID=1686402 RepID=A0ABW5KNK2_9SPHI